MGVAMEVEIIKKEIIKPSSPTPPELKSVKLSILDQLTPVTYTPIILFYPADNGVSDTDHHRANYVERSQKLKTWLSQTLTLWYPLAGRLKDNSFIECDDQGSEYLEARMKCPLSDILNKPHVEMLNQFLPAAIESLEATTGYLLLVQATFFECGGLALGICISHKVADAATFTAFIRSWSAMANSSSSEVMHPVFMGASIFPPIDMSSPMTTVELMQRNCITTRFVFNASKIAALKAKVSSTSVPDPSRVEAVAGLLWKCAMAAARSNSVKFKPSIWTISVNLRKRMVKPLPENYAGNYVGSIKPKNMEAKELELQDIVGRIRKEKGEYVENYAKKLGGEGAVLAICGSAKEFGELAMSSEVEFYVCTSWCRYDLYGADFGWGKAIWVSTASTKMRNVAVMIDTRDGYGIEVWLTLIEEHMALLESNQELLEFAEINPSVPLS